MKNIILTIPLLFLFACHESKKDSIKNLNQNVTKSNSKNGIHPFFQFDEVDHYHVDITSKQWAKIANKEDKKSADEKLFLEILNQDNLPKNINDITFIKNIEKFYPKKTKIEKNKFKEIDIIYSEKYYGDYVIAGCLPNYRDVLVFKRNKIVTGISKICFECQLHYTIGTKRNTEQLGQNGDYKKLYQLLNKWPAANNR